MLIDLKRKGRLTPVIFLHFHDSCWRMYGFVLGVGEVGQKRILVQFHCRVAGRLL